jgi:type II secretory pathway pseudopilin PulG
LEIWISVFEFVSDFEIRYSILCKMTNRKIQTKRGLTLTEMTVVIVTIALLVALGLPAIRAFLDSFESGSGAKSTISAALASARAIAAREQRYAGVRFQKRYDPKGLLGASQYMILIIQDPDIGVYFFRAVEGIKPIKLPDSIGVTDLTIVRRRNSTNPGNPSIEVCLDDPRLTDAERDAMIDEGREFTDTTAFSIIFSPSGKLVGHGVRVRNRDGYVDTQGNAGISLDDVFNKKAQVDNGIGMFYQDDYFGVLDIPDYPDLIDPDLGLGPEPSRNSFVIYETEKFNQAYKKGRAWSECLVRVPERVHINSYTGTIISTD